jgi:tetratricopeptide (TPR) repeat protein
MARLDRLGAAKEVIQIGAVIGSDFSYALLQAVHPIAEAELQHALQVLVDAELLHVRGLTPDANYHFKHALIRDAAYEALLKSRRKELHLNVARAIEEQFLALKETHPEVLARHWAEAGAIQPAIAEWTKAGRAAESRNAFMEALESYRQALALLKLSPESTDRDLRELELRQSIVSLLQVTRGLAAPETINATEHVAGLAQRSGQLAQLVTSLIARGTAAYSSGDLTTAATVADQALDLAIREGSFTSLAQAHFLQLTTRYQRGDLAGAEKYFTAGLNFFGDPGWRQFPGSRALTFGIASWNAWMLGRTEVARERDLHTRASASESNPYDVALSVMVAAQLRLHMREYKPAEILAVKALEVSEKNQFPQIGAFSRCIFGQAQSQLGRVAEGIVLIRDGMHALLAIGSPLAVGIFAAGLATAQERAGSIIEALETIEQALKANPEDLAYRPETLRVWGELRLKQFDARLAEASFREAIDLAQTMSAKAWELRATMSLARLLCDTGRRDQARTMLAEIYNWFTEGFDTADLKDAKTLLDELSG